MKRGKECAQLFLHFYIHTGPCDVLMTSVLFRRHICQCLSVLSAVIVPSLQWNIKHSPPSHTCLSKSPRLFEQWLVVNARCSLYCHNRRFITGCTWNFLCWMGSSKCESIHCEEPDRFPCAKSPGIYTCRVTRMIPLVVLCPPLWLTSFKVYKYVDVRWPCSSFSLMRSINCLNVPVS